MPDNLIPNPNYNPAIPVSPENQPVVFATPETAVINPQTGQTAINAASLQPVAPITLPVVPPDTTNYQGEIAGGQAMVDAITKQMEDRAKEVKEEAERRAKETGGLGDLWTQFMAGQEAPPSVAGAYTAAGGTAPTGAQLTGMETGLAVDEAALQTATDELNDLTIQMQVLTQEAQAIPERLQQEATGRGITAGGLAPIQTAQLRDIYLRQLPLSGQILIAQGKQLAAQGKVNLSIRKLELAQAKFDRYFDLVIKDIENKYNYDKELRDKAFEFATVKEQRIFDAQQKEDDRTYQESRDNLKLQQDWVAEAIKNAQGDLAGKIAQLSPSDPDFITKLGVLQAQLKVIDPEIKSLRDKYIDAGILDTDTREQAEAKVRANSKIYREQIRPPREPQVSQTEKENAEINRIKNLLVRGPGGNVDLNEYRRLKQDSTLDPYTFDSQFGSMLSIDDQKKEFGLTATAARTDKAGGTTNEDLVE